MTPSVGRAVRAVAAASRVALVSLATLLSTACAPDRPARLDAARGASERPWSRARCASRIDATLAEWGAGPEYLGSPPSRTGAATIRLPTSELGHWAVVIVRQYDDEPTVDLVSNKGLVRRQFGDDCSVQERRSDGVGLVDAFGDEELRTALEEARRGVVVYAWSPHMPLSQQWTGSR